MVGRVQHAYNITNTGRILQYLELKQPDPFGDLEIYPRDNSSGSKEITLRIRAAKLE